MTMYLDWESYKSYVFDFDGVILDSNRIKEFSIRRSAEGFASPETLELFVDYFTRFNGVPRKVKVERFFSGSAVSKILSRYSEYLESSLFEADLIPGIRELLSNIRKLPQVESVYVVSGGEKSEIEKLLLAHDLAEYFDGVYAAPKEKLENLECISPPKPCVFFGDSLVDYQASIDAGLDFVFVYGASQVENWQSSIDQSNVVACVRDFFGVQFRGA